MGVGILVSPALAHAKHFFRIVFPDFVIGDDRNPNPLEHGLLVPRLPHAVTIDRAGFQRGRHLRGRSHRQQHIRLQLTAGIALVGSVVPRVQTPGGQPVTQLVVMGGYRKHHAHVERLAFRLVLFHYRLEGVGLDGVHRFTVLAGNIFLHFFPDRVGHGNAVTIQVHAEGRNDVRLGAITNRGSQWLTCQHMRAIELTVNHPVQQHFPVGLGFQSDEKPLFFEIPFLVRYGERRHVRKFDKTKFQVGLLRPAHRICRHGVGREPHGQRCQCRTNHFFHQSSLTSPLSGRHKKSAQGPPSSLTGYLERLCSNLLVTAVGHEDGYVVTTLLL